MEYSTEYSLLKLMALPTQEPELLPTKYAASVYEAVANCPSQALLCPCFFLINQWSDISWLVDSNFLRSCTRSSSSTLMTALSPHPLTTSFTSLVTWHGSSQPLPSFSLPRFHVPVPVHSLRSSPPHILNQ